MILHLQTSPDTSNRTPDYSFTLGRPWALTVINAAGSIRRDLPHPDTPEATRPADVHSAISKPSRAVYRAIQLHSRITPSPGAMSMIATLPYKTKAGRGADGAGTPQTESLSLPCLHLRRSPRFPRWTMLKGSRDGMLALIECFVRVLML